VNYGLNRVRFLSHILSSKGARLALGTIVADLNGKADLARVEDLTHLSMRVGLYLHPRGVLAIQSLRLPPPFRGLGSVLPYRSRDVGSTNFDEWSSGALLRRTPNLQKLLLS
jgi:hypothetical protein